MQALIGIGSNEDAATNIRRALDALRQSPNCRVVAVSSFYRNPARDRHGKPTGAAAYVNGAAVLETHLGVDALTARLKEIETACGRTRTVRSAVTVDLDLVLFVDTPGERVGPTLVRPSELAKPYFILPAAEVAGDWPIPGQAQTITALVAAIATQELEFVHL